MIGLPLIEYEFTDRFALADLTFARRDAIANSCSTSWSSCDTDEEAIFLRIKRYIIVKLPFQDIPM